MNKIYMRFSLMLFFIILAGFVKAQTSVYYESFTPGQTNWTNYDDESSNEKLEGGKYFLTHKKSTSYSYKGIPVTLDESRNYSIETIVTHVTGTDQYPIGLVFGGQDVSNLYSFAISANGSYLLSRKE